MATGGIQMLVCAENGAVMLQFSQPIDLLALTPEQAKELARLLVEASDKINP